MSTKLNCFEARQGFAAFWRRELTPERRSELVSHLAECARCDRAFRDFAVSAPALHSASEPPRGVAAERSGVLDSNLRRPAGVIRGYFQPQRFAMSAAAIVLVAASLAAYLSAAAPAVNLNDELSADPGVTQLLGSELGLSSEDLAG